MKALVRMLAVALFTMMVVGCGSKQVVWQYVIDKGGDETATALTSDGTNYYVSYIAVKPGDNSQTGWFITKLDQDGKEIWTNALKDSLHHSACEDVQTDGQGHLFATGRTRVQDKELCLVVRYAPDGSIVWQKGLEVGDKTWGMGICPVSGDRVAVCGVAGSDTNTDHMVALLDANDGKTLWVKNVDLGPSDLAARIAADSKDNLVIVGHRGGTGAGSDVVIVKLAPNGDTLWTRTYDSGGDDQPGDIKFDPFGNIVATATATVNDSVHCVILEYDTDGGSIRKAAYGAQTQATGNGIFINKDTDIFITGRLFNKKTTAPGESEQILAFQYKPNATSVWERTYSPGHLAGGVDLVVNGDVYVAANMKNKTDDVLVCRLSRPIAPALPAAK